MKKILITGCAGAAATNFIKCLKNSALELFIVGTDMNAMQLGLSLCDKTYQVLSCLDDEYINQINDIIKREQIDLLYPQTDMEVEIISKKRDELLCNVFLPVDSAVQLCRNKQSSYERMLDSGVAVADSVEFNNPEEVVNLFGEMISKHSKLWVRASKGAGSRAALPVKDLAIAREWIKFWTDSNRLEVNQFQLSEFLPGKDFAFQSVWYKGELICSFARERLEYMFGNLMPSGQSSSASVARSIHSDIVNQTAVKAIRSVDSKPHGVFCVDLKENKHGVPCVTEINIGRFFTTCDFAMKAGCNMPEIYLQLAFGIELCEKKPYNSIEENLLWIRNVDREPVLVKE